MPDPMLPKGLLCDMDDTILNSSGAREQCWREAFAAEAGRSGGLDWTAFIGLPCPKKIAGIVCVLITP